MLRLPNKCLALLTLDIWRSLEWMILHDDDDDNAHWLTVLLYFHKQNHHSVRSYVLLKHRVHFPFLVPHKCSHKQCLHPFWICQTLSLNYSLGRPLYELLPLSLMGLDQPSCSSELSKSLPYPPIIKTLYCLCFIHVWFCILFCTVALWEL